MNLLFSFTFTIIHSRVQIFFKDERILQISSNEVAYFTVRTEEDYKGMLLRHPTVFESRIFNIILDSLVIFFLNHVHIIYVHDRLIISLHEDFESWLDRNL